MSTSNKCQDSVPEPCVNLVWSRIQTEAKAIYSHDTLLEGWVHHFILSRKNLPSAIIVRLTETLATPHLNAQTLSDIFHGLLEHNPDDFNRLFAHDVLATYNRDPVCDRFIEPVIYFKGFLALACHRFAHALWQSGRKDLALILQSRCSQVVGIDIHPAVRMGYGIMLDHGSGIVIGETTTLGDQVSILQNATLGGNGKDTGDRHPKIGKNVLIGAGAVVLGNLNIGECARIAASAVVLHDVPPRTTVAGIPAKVIGDAPCPEPALTMDHFFSDNGERH